MVTRSLDGFFLQLAKEWQSHTRVTHVVTHARNPSVGDRADAVRHRYILPKWETFMNQQRIKRKFVWNLKKVFNTKKLLSFVELSGSGTWESLFWLPCVLLCDKNSSIKCLSKKLRLCLEQCNKWIYDTSLSSSFLKNNGKDTLSRLSWFTLFW
jgi:hypothetical protein